MKLNQPDFEERAVDHVEWLLTMLRPLLIDHLFHGYKHGWEDMAKEYEESMKIGMERSEK